jgi:hypothetical protein
MPEVQDCNSTKFEYNGYLQVKKISNLSAETTPRVLNAVETNLSAPPSPLGDRAENVNRES